MELWKVAALDLVKIENHHCKGRKKMSKKNQIKIGIEHKCKLLSN